MQFIDALVLRKLKMVYSTRPKLLFRIFKTFCRYSVELNLFFTFNIHLPIMNFANVN